MHRRRLPRKNDGEDNNGSSDNRETDYGKVTTEAAETEETTTAASSEEGGSTVKYVNIEDPDTSSKGNDWYDKKLYTPGNVTDDAYLIQRY